MKTKLTAVLLAAVLAAALSACSLFYPNTPPVDPTDATQAAAQTEAPVDASAEQPTEAATEAPAIGTAEDYVITVREYTSPYGGIFNITDEPRQDVRDVTSRLPQLTIDSEDAQSINAQIHEKYDSVFDACDQYGADEYTPRTDYIAHLNGSVLTLVVESRTVNTPNSVFGAYNIDVLTGKELTKEEVLARANISEEDANAQVAAEIENLFANAQVADESITADPHERSLSDENLADNRYYFDADGTLCAAYRYYWFAGAGDYGAICKLDAHIQ